MADIITIIHTTRTHYSAEEAAKYSITVADLISALEQYDEDTKVVFCNDNGYTYGEIHERLVDEIELEEEEEEEDEE